MLKNILTGVLSLLSIFLAFIVIDKSIDVRPYLFGNSSVDATADGPYLFVDGNNIEAIWLCEDVVSMVSIPVKVLSEDVNSIQFGDSKQPTILTYQGDYQVAALSDLHGQYDLMKTLLRNNKIIDEKGNWNFNNGHFVITGDVFDRGDKVTEILWFLYKLEHQAAEAGGQLHLLLGNHEVMILNDDLRYMNPKYQNTVEKLHKSYADIFSSNSILGNWLRKKPVLVKVNNMLFVHGGFHPKLVTENKSIEEINKVFIDNLIKTELAGPRDEWAEYLHTKNGPIWYRGYFNVEGATIQENATSEEIYGLLEHFDVETIIVGHTSQKKIETRYQGKVIAIDASIKEGKYGEILFIDKGNKWRGTLSGERLKLE